MTKIFDIIQINGFFYVYIPDKRVAGGWEIFEGQLNLVSDDVKSENKVIATDNPSLGLPLLPSIEEDISYAGFNNLWHDLVRKEMPLFRQRLMQYTGDANTAIQNS